jgi:3'(2'), 5'-bisphosphate nucleotidase
MIWPRTSTFHVKKMFARTRKLHAGAAGSAGTTCKGQKKTVTLDAPDYGELALSLIPAAQRAGAAIMDVYRSVPNVRYKADRSPVTDADEAAEHIILEALSKLMPGVPVVAEEQAAAGKTPGIGAEFFLVDPLDGTKEFLKLNGEFTVNIALVIRESPVFGLIFAPAKADCYLTLGANKAVRCELHPAHNPTLHQALEFTILTGEARPNRPMTALVSRSHLRPETQPFLVDLRDPPRMVMGSSLKFGLLANGEADVYPRFGPTSEWDIAAGQAIVVAAGGCVVTSDGKPLLYGKRDEGFVNPSFIAWRRASDASMVYRN